MADTQTRREAHPDTRAMRQVGVLNVPVLSAQAALSDMLSALNSGRALRVAFANTHLAYCALRDPRLARSLGRFYLLNDGIGFSLLAHVSNGAGFEENLNGTDFIPRLLASAPRGARLFLVGARSHVVAEAALRLARAHPHLVICGACDGYRARGEDKQAIIDEIQATQAQIVLVAMGNPLQEVWIEEAANAGAGGLYLGVGAFFDFIAGAQARAPVSLRRLRLEWLYRLSREPKRMGRRYTVEIAILAASCFWRRLNGRGGVA